ncbi:mitochondrial coenzyme A diphosphatase NUDT8-like [Hydractinia symbiolongicarpus]|uniref:mitochondrial coenzyme A diphosphatase NUDT8-like n=1 Tax=Hydractinia symbiolongicarpus TaxID=13093 RepID=UPI002550EC7F|nr:mitochondrial coenzyme A diphosphatase NUDT8-like [Hydractinia symbiolongicarpus]
MKKYLYAALHKSMLRQVVKCVRQRSSTCYNGFCTSCVPPHLSEELIRKQFFENKNKMKLLQDFQVVNSKIKMKPKETTASVLMPLCIVDNQISLLYTICSSNLPTQKGQVCFPGGMVSSVDSSLLDAALRETEEELGINMRDVSVWGFSADYPEQLLRYNVRAYLGYLGMVDFNTLNINKTEVNEVFALPIQHLMNAKNQRYTIYRFGIKMPVLLNSHKNIWGLTAVFTDALLTAAFPHHHDKIFQQFDVEAFLNASHSFFIH